MLECPASRLTLIAVLRGAAMICGPAPVRTAEWSSPKVTSRTQWRVFSICQWPRSQIASRTASAYLPEHLIGARDAVEPEGVVGPRQRLPQVRGLRTDDRPRPTHRGGDARVQAEVQSLLAGGEPFPGRPGPRCCAPTAGTAPELRHCFAVSMPG